MARSGYDPIGKCLIDACDAIPEKKIQKGFSFKDNGQCMSNKRVKAVYRFDWCIPSIGFHQVLDCLLNGCYGFFVIKWWEKDREEDGEEYEGHSFNCLQSISGRAKTITTI